MKNKLSDISETLKVEKLKNERQIIIFMICLLIATILWFLNALSKEYSTYVSYPVKYVNPPKNQFLSTSLPSRLEMKVEAHGFILLRHKLSFSFSPILLNLTTLTSNLEPVNGNYTLYTATLLNTLSNQVSKEISITEIKPEVLVFKLDSLITKTVNIQPDIKIEFNPQFNLKEPVSVIPKQVLITGPASVVDTIFSLKTEYKSFEKVEKSFEKVVPLVYPLKTEVNPGKVTLKFPVEKFTEKEVKIPVQLKNKPEGIKVKLFPSEITVTFMVGLSEYENIRPEHFRAFVDFDYRMSGSESLEVQFAKQPSYIQVLRITPKSVEFLTENE